MSIDKVDSNFKRCGLYLGVIITLGGIAGGFMNWAWGIGSDAQAWVKVRELKDELHDEKDKKHDETLSVLQEFNIKQVEAQKTACALGRGIPKYWCTMMGFPWNSLEGEH